MFPHQDHAYSYLLPHTCYTLHPSDPPSSTAATAVLTCPVSDVDCVWNVMAHAQKPDFVFQRNARVHLIRWGRQFSRLLAAEVCASAVVMLDTPCSEVVWRILATHAIRQFPLHFPSRALPCAITFQLDCTSRVFHSSCILLMIMNCQTAECYTRVLISP